LSPSPFKERGIGHIREASPLFDSPYSILFLKRGGGRILKRGSRPPLKHPVRSNLLLRRGEEIKRGGFAPSLTYIPPSLIKGRGSGG